MRSKLVSTARPRLQDVLLTQCWGLKLSPTVLRLSKYLDNLSGTKWGVIYSCIWSQLLRWTVSLSQWASDQASACSCVESTLPPSLNAWPGPSHAGPRSESVTLARGPPPLGRRWRRQGSTICPVWDSAAAQPGSADTGYWQYHPHWLVQTSAAANWAKWKVQINVKYAINGLLHIWHIKLHILHFFTAFFACLTNTVYIFAYLMPIFCILLAYICIFNAYKCTWHIICIFSAYFMYISCIFDQYSLYICIFSAYLLHTNAYFMHITAYYVHICAYLSNVLCIYFD